MADQNEYMYYQQDPDPQNRYSYQDPIPTSGGPVGPEHSPKKPGGWRKVLALVLVCALVGGGAGAGGAYAADKELQEIFERTYGKVEHRAFEPAKKPARTSLSDHYSVTLQTADTEYLLVDGYNIIFAWDELSSLASQDIAAARGALIDILANYQGFRKCRVIVVFDAYKVKGNPGSVQTVHGVKVVYTKEAETADTYIERATYELRRERRVRVATSDGPEQVIILGHGALRVSARAFHAEVEAAEGQISAVLQRLTNRPRSERTIRNNVKLKQ